jgi:hypothetical protein
MDLSAAFLGNAKPERGQAVMWVRPPDRPGPNNSFPDLAIREGNWKLLVHRDGSRAELFDVKADPNETKNLAGEQAEMAKRLAEEVMGWEKGIP